MSANTLNGVNIFILINEVNIRGTSFTFKNIKLSNNIKRMFFKIIVVLFDEELICKNTISTI